MSIAAKAPELNVAIFPFWDAYIRPKANELLTDIIHSRFFWHYQDEAIYEYNQHPYVPLERLETVVKNAWITTANKLQSKIVIDPTFIDSWFDWSIVRSLIQREYETEQLLKDRERVLRTKKRKIELELEECERLLKRARKE